MKIYYTEFNSNCIQAIVEAFKKIGFTLLDNTIKSIQENLGDDAFLVAIDDEHDDNIVKYIGNDIFADVIKNHQYAERLKINGPIYKEGDMVFDKKRLRFFNIIKITYIFDGKYVVKAMFDPCDNNDYEFWFECQDDWIYIGNNIYDISLNKVIEYLSITRNDVIGSIKIPNKENKNYCFCIENIMPYDILSFMDTIIVVKGIDVDNNKIISDTAEYDFDSLSPVLLNENFFHTHNFVKYEEDGIVYFVYSGNNYNIILKQIDDTHYEIESMDLPIQFVHDLQHVMKHYEQNKNFYKLFI